ncbi:MAG: hypothetical protein OXQ28_00260 [Acidobacteriota bacterium]|nr:hypothetical protein [Acidobacteriota bacterium]
MKKGESRAATAAELPAGTDAPREILLLPAGDIPTRPHDPRAPWRNPDADAVVAATRELGLEIAVDYEHQTQRAEQNGQPAPAAGWIKRVFARGGAVWGEVEWTDRAKAMIGAKEYRFISPTFIFDKATRTVARIVGAALTNDPAFYMRAIAHTQPHDDEEIEMDLEKLRRALGLAATATEAEITAAATAAAAAQTALGTIAESLGLAKDSAGDALAAAVAGMAKGRKAIAKAAGLAEDASAEDVEAAVKTAKASAGAGGDPDPAAFVPRAEFDRVNERLTTLETDGAAASATAAVDQAIKDGKVTPASRDWALGYAAKDPEGFAAFVKDAPKILSSGRVAPAASPGGGDALTDEEKAMCRATGVSEKEFLESKKALAGAGEEG